MDSRVLVFSLLAVVVASGCIDDPEQDTQPAVDDDLDVAIAEFSVSDDEVFVDQRFQVDLILQNHGNQPMGLERVALYNLNQFETLGENNAEYNCGSTEIPPAFEGTPGEMACSWEVEAPEDLLHEERQRPFNAVIEYEAEVSTSEDPPQVSFKQLEDITETDTITRSWDNQEVQLSLRTQDPARMRGEIVDFGIQPIGDGEVLEGYEVDYEPSRLFDCPENVDYTVDAATEYSCEIAHEGESEVTEPLTVSAQYKYRRTPETSVRVVEP